MSDENVPVGLANFNNKVRAMNQKRGNELILSSNEARNLHNEVFRLLARNSELTERLENQEEQESISITMDGGNWNTSE